MSSDHNYIILKNTMILQTWCYVLTYFLKKL